MFNAQLDPPWEPGTAWWWLRHHVIPEVSHNANQDNPSDVNTELLAFLAGLQPGSTD